MANEKFSDFTPEADLANYTGLVGFDIGTDNFKITPNELANNFPIYLTGTITNMFEGATTRNFIAFAYGTPTTNAGSVLQLGEKWTLTDAYFKWNASDVWPTFGVGETYTIRLYSLNNLNDDASDLTNYTQVGPDIVEWTQAIQPPGGNYPYEEFTGLSYTLLPGTIYALVGEETGTLAPSNKDPNFTIRLIRDFT